MADKVKTPVELTLYGTDDQVTKELKRLIIPWGLLKKAARLQAELDADHVTDDDIDKISDLIIEIFGAEKVTRQELEDGADMGDMLAVLLSIVGRARGLIPNVATPAKKKK